MSVTHLRGWGLTVVFAATLDVVAAGSATAAQVDRYVGQPVAEVTLVSEGRTLRDPSILDLVETEVGLPLSMRQVRESLTHLFSLGTFQDVQVAGGQLEHGVSLEYQLVPLAVIERIDIEGDTGISRGDLRTAIADAHGVLFEASVADSVSDTLRRMYRARGFFRPQVSTRVDGEVSNRTLRVTVQAGQRARIEQVFVTGVSSTLYASTLSRLGLEAGQAYDGAAIDRRLLELEAELREERYYQARLSHTIDVVAGGNAVDLRLDIRRGPRISLVFAGDEVPGGDPTTLVPVEREGSVDEDLLEDALFHERKRLERHPGTAEEGAALDSLTGALVRGDRSSSLDAANSLVSVWADEIHGRFSRRLFRTSTRVLPRALTGLLTARPAKMRNWDLSPERRLRVEGDLPLLQQLAREATLVLVPTHVSNLDSPLIGLALHLAGLPPFVYGAGLNLFSNPIMGFFLGRLGAYTVDRTKKAALYKDVLKDYSVRCLTTRHHSLFFPGGTRARSGALETHVKKGLLGTGVVAWQEMLRAGRADSEVYVVPLTLSFSLVLEAASLIEDHLAEAGKRRYIITDDEFAQPRRLASFSRRVLELDSAIVARFGQPLDPLGRPVPSDPSARLEASRRRRRYVCSPGGSVEEDPQRDRVYTQRLADAIVGTYPKDTTVMVTHLAAWTAWRCLEETGRTTDRFQLVRQPIWKRRFNRLHFLRRLEEARRQVVEGAVAGRWHHDLPKDAGTVLDLALERFACYHRSRALCVDGEDVLIEDPKLALYYRNRLEHMPLEV